VGCEWGVWFVLAMVGWMMDGMGMALQIIPIIKALAPLLPAAGALVKRLHEKRVASFSAGARTPEAVDEWMGIFEEQAQVIEQLTAQANNLAVQLQKQEGINRRMKRQIRIAIAVGVAALGMGLFGVVLGYLAI